MRKLALVLLSLLCLPLFLQPALAAPQPDPSADSAAFGWGREPVETLSATRGQICLNGVWRFIPAGRETAAGQPATEVSQTAPPTDGWGTIRVPGAWGEFIGSIPLPGVVTVGAGPAWNGLTGSNTGDPWNSVRSAWYERTISIPAGWRGRRILVDFLRVSTQAHVWVDGVDCGQVGWPGGSVDITKAVRAGELASLAVLVTAAPDAAMRAGDVYGPNAADPKALESRGIISDVTLESQPIGAHVSDVFVQPSTRKHTLTLDIELSGVTHAGSVELTARCLDEHGHVEKSFHAIVHAGAQGTQTERVSWGWPNPRLWDFNHPNLYTLQLRAQGAGIRDEYPQTFGFREFWITGRSYYMNGIPVRLQPTVLANWGEGGCANAQEIDSVIDGYRATGFNVEEFWPWDERKPSTTRFVDLWSDCADRKGWALIAPLPALDGLRKRWWSSRSLRAAWVRSTEAEVKRLRNHPSILIWVHSPNSYYFGGNDSNPYWIGRPKQLRIAARRFDYDDLFEGADDADRIIKQTDPTRPVMVHSGIVGDIQTANHYPDMTQFQETEEWLSNWVQHGQVPYMPIEFGPIGVCDFRRGHQWAGWGGNVGGAVYSENELTEYLAMLYGNQAYKDETDEQRSLNPTNFVKDQYYKYPNYEDTPLEHQFAADEIKETYLGWRTIGAAGIGVPWDFGSWFQWDGAPVPAAPFVPGERGAWHATIPLSMLSFLRAPGATPLVPGKALAYSLQPTLAWIVGPAVAGDPAAFADKAHSFRAGALVQKRAALINDTRQSLPYRCAWSVEVGGKTVASGHPHGTIAAAGRVFAPITFRAPAMRTRNLMDGRIRLDVIIGAVRHADTFAFRVFSQPTATGQAIAVVDPLGLTTHMLHGLGCKTVRWDGNPGRGLIVVGRDALASGKAHLAQFEPFVRNGGRLLIMEQQPQWIRDELGMRVGHQLMRRVFCIASNKAVTYCLDDTDLANWAGSSTLIPAHPLLTFRDDGPVDFPYYGWHWSNRAAVTSADIEKPHYGSWRPILECDFDSAFTPLMEMEYGKGRVILCTLDLEDHAATDAAAAQLARNLLSYACMVPVAPKAERVVYVGGDAWAKRLFAMGVVMARSVTLPASADVLIVDPDSSVDSSSVEQLASAGCRVLVLPEEAGHSAFGARYTERAGAHGSLNVPNWPECRGLSESDLRVRATHTDWLITGGAEIGADGLLARRVIGKGVIIFTQTDPERFDADKLTYFRFSRWRQSRALCQILSNLGASFVQDAQFFTPAVRQMPDKPDAMWLLPGPPPKNKLTLYYPDYRSDFDLGDDPHRYCGW